MIVIKDGIALANSWANFSFFELTTRAVGKDCITSEAKDGPLRNESWDSSTNSLYNSFKNLPY